MENPENPENLVNRRTVGSVCESLYPLLDPEGRGHCEYQILVDYIQAHVDSRTSSSHHHLARLQQSLQATIQTNTRLEQQARAAWTHQPALMVASWPSMQACVFSGSPDHVHCTTTDGTTTDAVSVTLDALAVYGVDSSVDGARLTQPWLNLNLSPQRRQVEVR